MPAQQNAIQIIRNEHASLAAVVHGMLHFIRTIDPEQKVPDLKMLRAMLLYVNDYPERVHHPNEDRYLFARLRKRTSELDSTLAELEFQHASGTGLIRSIEHALVRFEFKGASAFPTLRDLVEEYARFYFDHMRLEEKLVLPAAERFLTEEDWIAIDAAFSGTRDPLTGIATKDDFDKLFSLIISNILQAS